MFEIIVIGVAVIFAALVAVFYRSPEVASRPITPTPPSDDIAPIRTSDDEMQAAVEHCRKIKAHFNATKGDMRTKREQHTCVPMSFWNLLEEMLTDEKIK